MIRTIILTALVVAGLAAATADPSEPPALTDRYTVVDALFSSQVAKDGSRTETVRRYVLKGATVIKLGDRWFLSGRTPVEDKVLVEGSNWNSIVIPVDLIRAMSGLGAPAALVEHDPKHALLGVEVD
jgi:hypothetical protein